ncbi:enhancer of mRNA-decapping protein 4 isoform X2 [Nilaparvata lugens]|nr:enhancer of mRNA-decapping protein 4 isoform X2 [Nilaparvata lugens]
MGGVYVAYGINSTAKGGIVRVISNKSQQRGLIKGLNGLVDDIAFAHTAQQVMLACVDKTGNLFVNLINESKDVGITCSRVLWVEPDENARNGIPSLCHRVIWCPYIPDGEPGSDYSVAELMAVTRGSKIELWNVGMVANHHRSGPVRPGEHIEGFIEINEHSQMIVDAAFSPDGTAIATASMDGEVKFFQVYMQDKSKARCLHEWKPHDGNPLSALFFMDNHKNCSIDVQFWKYVITGCNSNSELKLWACQTWECVQTIRFLPRPETSMRVQLKAAVDRSSDYLLLSNMKQRVLYVLRIQKDSAQTNCFIQSVSEFPLPYPILSFAILDAEVRRFKSNSSFTLDDQCNGDEDDDKQEQDNQSAVLIKMYLVQPKSLQECNILFQTRQKSIDGRSGSQNSLGYNENDENGVGVGIGGEQVSVEMAAAAVALPSMPMPNHSPMHINLITPDAFDASSNTLVGSIPSVKMEEETSFHETVNKLSNSTTPLPKPDLPCGGVVAFASGGSSPSREVQEIFSSQEPQRGSEYSEYPEADEMLQVSDLEIDLTSVNNRNIDLKSVNNLDLNMSTGVNHQLDMTSREMSPSESNWSSSIPNMMSEKQLNKPEMENPERANGQIHSFSVDQTDMKNIANSLALIQSTIAKQQNEIKCLREEVLRLNNPREFEKVLSRKLNQQCGVIEKSLTGLCTKEDNKKNQESSISAISQAINNLISSKLDDIVASEISNSILPVIVETMENLKQNLHIDMTQKLSATDHLLKENINKMVSSKSVTDALSNSLSRTLTPMLSETLRDFFMNVALPRHEKASALMFNQLNDAFSKGTREYLAALENHAKKISEKGKESAAQMQSTAEHVKNSGLRMSNDLNETTKRIEKIVEEALRVQQSALEQTLMTAVRSGACTPAPHSTSPYQLKLQQIKECLQNANFESAFEIALQSGNLNLVVATCEKVNPNRMFKTKPCLLSQKLLLCLIQQLGNDLTSHTELKRKYLEEAVISLDFNSETTQQYALEVLNKLQKQLSAYIASNQDSDFARSFQILLMAVQATANSTNCK